jgi:hypothetical protein
MASFESTISISFFMLLIFCALYAIFFAIKTSVSGPSHHHFFKLTHNTAIDLPLYEDKKILDQAYRRVFGVFANTEIIRIIAAIPILLIICIRLILTVFFKSQLTMLFDCLLLLLVFSHYWIINAVDSFIRNKTKIAIEDQLAKLKLTRQYIVEKDIFFQGNLANSLINSFPEISHLAEDKKKEMIYSALQVKFGKWSYGAESLELLSWVFLTSVIFTKPNLMLPIFLGIIFSRHAIYLLIAKKIHPEIKTMASAVPMQQ